MSSVAARLQQHIIQHTFDPTNEVCIYAVLAATSLSVFVISQLFFVCPLSQDIMPYSAVS